MSDRGGAVRHAMLRMRETNMCVPPGHCWPPGRLHPVGDPCACGETLMDEATRAALDWRCESRSLPAGRGETAALTPTVGRDRQEEEQ